MQLIFVDGSKLTTEDGIAIYCSRKIGRFPETSSLQQEAQLILDINETLTIRFKSIRKFDFHSNSERKEKVFTEEGTIALHGDKDNLRVRIHNVITYFQGGKYDYRLNLPDGTLYLSNEAYSNLLSAIRITHKSPKRELVQRLVTAICSVTDKILGEQKEKLFLYARNQLSLWQAPWTEFSDTYGKIQIFVKKYAFSLFMEPDKIAAFEAHFFEKWVSASSLEKEGRVLLQTKLQETSQDNPLPKFDALVRLVSASCGQEEHYAACRTYGIMLAAIKEEARLQCNVTYDITFQADWSYEDCLKNYVSGAKESYQDIDILGCFIYYLMSENKIPLPPKFERTPYNLGFEYAYYKVKQDLEPYAKAYFENLEVLQLERELSLDTPSSVITIEDFDLMSGQEFERAVADIFTSMGYQISMTPITGDQGIDIIAVRNGTRIGIQAKCYTGKVPNSAVQEVVAGKEYYGVHRCIVVTNSSFTNSAIDLAKANHVALWDRSILEEKLSCYHGSDSL